MTEIQEPITPRARETYDNLLRSAEEIFEERGFYRSSVAEICRKANVSNGTFYRYFTDKSDIFVRLAEGLGADLTGEIKGNFLDSKEPFNNRLELLLQTYFSFLSDKSSLYQIFRQAEFVNWNTHQAFYTRLTETLASGFSRGIDSGYFRDHNPQVMAHYLLGTLSFVSMRWIIWESSTVKSEVVKNLLNFLTGGLSNKDRDSAFDKPSFTPLQGSNDHDKSELPSETSNKTEIKLLTAAELRFGADGFYGTTIGDITRQAEVAQGTFYHHFSSKLEVFERLVREINERWRREVRKRTFKLDDRRAREFEGFRVFFTFIANHSGMYRIVREAEFVDKSLGRWYYESFAEGYREALRKASKKGEIREIHPGVLAYSLMGIGHFLGQKWFVQENRDRTPAREFETMFDLILNGLRA
ncbi:TetR/AcrR family transcriptional regulator [Candidatus Bipolaricaulota bacterium]|nr:TetR/AcrR family transcriptional regulator [Candidatus Bipolaricaulota bacterium]MBS3792602.1 TetR/AcrR family transcriptional regulator [Candidatus Bipolaricaulota bacterium]